MLKKICHYYGITPYPAPASPPTPPASVFFHTGSRNGPHHHPFGSAPYGNFRRKEGKFIESRIIAVPLYSFLCIGGNLRFAGEASMKHCGITLHFQHPMCR